MRAVTLDAFGDLWGEGYELERNTLSEVPFGAATIDYPSPPWRFDEIGKSTVGSYA
jgi:hypothetical protein